jgi:hypothetical protein
MGNGIDIQVLRAQKLTTKNYFKHKFLKWKHLGWQKKLLETSNSEIEKRIDAMIAKDRKTKNYVCYKRIAA